MTFETYDRSIVCLRQKLLLEGALGYIGELARNKPETIDELAGKMTRDFETISSPSSESSGRHQTCGLRDGSVP